MPGPYPEELHSRMLFLVRHAMPVSSPQLAARKWPLTRAGLAASRALMARLPPRAFLVASSERKAVQTLAVSTSTVHVDARFDEVVRDGDPWGGNHLDLRRRYVEGVRHPGWEPHATAAARFAKAVEESRDLAGDRPVVIASHGMIMTTWLVSIGAVGRERAGEYWAGLRFPDCHLVNPDRTSIRPY